MLSGKAALIAGQKSDAPQAAASIAEVVMADTAYEIDTMRQAIADKGVMAAIPNNPSRTFSTASAIIECCFSKLKRFRCIAARFEKNRTQLPRHRPICRRHTMAAVTGHTT